MFSLKCCLLIISAHSFILSFAQEENKFFRNDYRKYIPETDSFYKIQTVPKTWQQAKEQCEIEGAELFYPEDEDEANAVIAYWNSTQPYYWIYIGISAPYVPELFETISGVPVYDVYDHWGPGEPNNAGGVENCVILRRDGTLNDDRCDRPNPYICKKRASSIEWNLACNAPDPKYEYKDLLGRCYKFHTTPRNWTDALKVCYAEQSYLAIIDSQLEAEYLANLTRLTKKDNVMGNYVRGAVHLGFVKKNSQWRTLKGRPLSLSGYKEWGHNQPDGGDMENCGSMFYSGKLNDINCKQKCFFICEKEISLLESVLEVRFGDYSNAE